MLSIMLCGASDTADIALSFAEVTTGFGGEPWHYQTGQILYLNTATASWEGNSRRTVAAADICVFVILRRYGEVTWNTELREALDAGKPFLILCLDSTYNEYLALTRNVPTHAIQNEDNRRLVETLTRLESERQLTVATFNFNTFKDVYRRETAKLIEVALELLTERFRRQALVGLLGDPANLTLGELEAAEALAVDEFEVKTARKQAISALIARQAASPETVLALLSSREQGVQRFAFSRIADLYTERPADPGFIDDCIALANDSDDTGVARRLIPEIFKIDVEQAVRRLESLDLCEIGSRRRLAEALEVHEESIRAEGLIQQAITLLYKCVVKSEDSGWLARCRSYILRLEAVETSTENDEPE
ncbi:MAG: hypothetical protein QM619_03000 [Micropruina sp.]|uniref:hypothetical protein n=1 Tax=Micropruina sp. TaxID=2737536 RepID=UPI0039E63578